MRPSAKGAQHNGVCVLNLIVEKFTEVFHIHSALRGIRHCGSAVQPHLRRTVRPLHRTDDVGKLANSGGLNQNPVRGKFLSLIHICRATASRTGATPCAGRGPWLSLSPVRKRCLKLHWRLSTGQSSGLHGRAKRINSRAAPATMLPGRPLLHFSGRRRSVAVTATVNAPLNIFYNLRYGPLMNRMITVFRGCPSAQLNGIGEGIFCL